MSELRLAKKSDIDPSSQQSAKGKAGRRIGAITVAGAVGLGVSSWGLYTILNRFNGAPEATSASTNTPTAKEVAAQVHMEFLATVSSMAGDYTDVLNGLGGATFTPKGALTTATRTIDLPAPRGANASEYTFTATGVAVKEGNKIIKIDPNTVTSVNVQANEHTTDGTDEYTLVSVFSAVQEGQNGVKGPKGDWRITVQERGGEQQVFDTSISKGNSVAQPLDVAALETIAPIPYQISNAAVNKQPIDTLPVLSAVAS